MISFLRSRSPELAGPCVFVSGVRKDRRQHWEEAPREDGNKSIAPGSRPGSGLDGLSS